ncbi:glycosyltransferase family 2 protein [Ruminiclostridium cellobioparum]|uniref:glycosyltransferase family 2 protein n=1 Tax=Ruminiclostridium cellobioparum TaxID=29355 RepID=UPI000485CFAE|nr:glycosyltransferase [Ruminiclostridium cellobioparum]
MLNETAAFIMPHYASDRDHRNILFLKAAIDGVFGQTDENWHLIIVDDASASIAAKDFLKDLCQKHPRRISVIFEDKNRGQGACRNIGIVYAYKNNFPIILFNDADDISHEKRLETVRKIFAEDGEADVVYTTFEVIDEHNRPVAAEKIAPSIQEIITSHKTNPPQGHDCWIRIGTDTGYVNLTSATAVRTCLAYKCPFPEERVSEDAVTWMKYSALGGKFVYTGEIPSLYRNPQNTEGSSSRTREGGREKFFEKVVKVNTEGFLECIDMGLKNGSLQNEQIKELMVKFYIKQAKTVYYEKIYDLAYKEISKALNLSIDLAFKNLSQQGLEDVLEKCL